MKNTVRSIRSLEFQAQKAAVSAVASFAEKHPEVLAKKFLTNPELVNGLKDFDYIVECLIKGGQSDKLQALADSRSIKGRAMTTIVEKLLTTM
jgi:hypothetical protein